MEVLHLTSRVQTKPFTIKDEGITCEEVLIKTVWVKDYVITVEVFPIIDVMGDEFCSNLVFNIRQPWNKTTVSPENALVLHQKIDMMIRENMINLAQFSLVDSYMIISPMYSEAQGENWWEKAS